MDYELLKKEFAGRYHAEPLIFRSPGRINIIGEHTDYNDGFVLPAGINKEIAFAISKNDLEFSRLYSLDLNEEYQFSNNNIISSGKGWPDYILGVVDQLQCKGLSVPGFDLVFGGNIPLGAGLSSSAALECGTIRALDHIFNFGLGKIEMAKLSQKAEIEFVGVNCGIMDQFASIFAEEHKAIFLDCRDISYRMVDLHLDNAEFILVNSMVKHSLATSEYNQRRADCEEVVFRISRDMPDIRALRDVEMDVLETYKNELSQAQYRHAAFVIHENQRVHEAVAALKKGDLISMGKLMYASHEGLSMEYEVSCPELDFLVDTSKNIQGVFGSRMMGGGFGGCTINLVERKNAADFMRETENAYNEKYGIIPEIYPVETASGSSQIA